MKKEPFSIFSIAVTLVILFGLSGCNLPLDDDVDIVGEVVVEITEVTVTPSGAGVYSLSVEYSRNFPDIPVTITCAYSTPDKNTYAILTINDDGKRLVSRKSVSQDFPVSQAGTEPEPGVYTATCSTDIGGSSKSTIFVVGDDPTAAVTIVSMIVVGGSGRSYVLELVYLIRTPDAVSFTCNYAGPDGAAMPIDNFTDDNHIPDNPLITKTLYFSVTDADLRYNPGTTLYTATCQDDEGRSKKSATFTVTGEATPTPTSTPTPTLTPTPTPTFTPITVSGTGRQIYVDGNSNNVNCTIPAELSLTVESDGRAELSITTRAMDRVYSTDITECFWHPESVTVTVSSNADRGSETVTINRDQYPLCDGTFSYAGGVLSGEFFCLHSATSNVGTKYVIP